jgi:hypothetical protein
MNVSFERTLDTFVDGSPHPSGCAQKSYEPVTAKLAPSV